jgi:hypothetical protein
MACSLNIYVLEAWSRYNCVEVVGPLREVIKSVRVINSFFSGVSSHSHGTRSVAVRFDYNKACLVSLAELSLLQYDLSHTYSTMLLCIQNYVYLYKVPSLRYFIIVIENRLRQAATSNFQKFSDLTKRNVYLSLTALFKGVDGRETGSVSYSISET